ncbi:family 2A encapsulin nanocompartment cargo protein cysteine desulfurase [Chryseobacterium sp.]|uniref:family 2A encapsulin nanocompartment cargo protein cysteine desulfurase n=1 Tax=Chryseobacterium sp. TaxID=1871047 RepID=UPI0025BDA620|nr:family 2A encapsulin nanocompartment cargo protein cysteine desulfurase [Chryseobacterium sp.]
MSINTDQLPDINELQNLANILFKALPNEVPKEITLNPENHPRAKKATEDLLNHLKSIESKQVWDRNHYFTQHEEFNKKGSSVDPGVFPSAIGSLNLKEENNWGYGSNLPQSTIGGRISPSAIGNGVTPSYINQGKHFNINDPETSFPDKNLDSSKTNNDREYNDLSGLFAYDSFFAELPEIFGLNRFNNEEKSYFNDPLSKIKDTTPSFYFLEYSRSYNSGLSDTSASQLNTLSGLHSFNADVIKRDFPILGENVNGKPLVWLDNAATTQKPRQVIERITRFYEFENSNIHRAAHELAARATDAYEAAREKVRKFIGARSVNEVIFVRGATEAINLVAQSWGDQYLKAGDEIIVSHLEHHANIVPWKRLADKKGLILKVIPVDDNGQIILDEYDKLLSSKTKLVAFTQVSNALGTVTPVQQMITMAHSAGAKVLVDGAQSVSHMAVNVQALDADWFVFSGHKVFGPTGIGVLYGKEEILNSSEPWQGGGNMIEDVTFEKIKYHKSPNRFEAGTGNIADAVGLGAAIDYVSKIGMNVIGQYEHQLLEYATYYMKQIPGIRLIGTAADKASVLSFTIKGFSNDEIGKVLNREGIAVRTGHHCAQPILRRMGVETTVRPSLAFYNTCEDVDRLISVLRKLTK